MADFLGSYNTATIRTHVGFSFTTHAQTGAAVAPSSAFENADILIYRAADGAAFSATQRSSTAGITMASPFDSITGLHSVDIDLTDNTDSGFYAAGYRYMVVLSPDTETVDTLVVVRVLAYFEIGPPPVNVTQWNGTAVSSPATAGIPDVNIKNAGNTAWASGSLTSGVFAAGAINAAAIADAAFDNATFAADTGLKTTRSGTAQAGASSAITLDSGADAANEWYRGSRVVVTGGTGAGQSRIITTYNGTTKVATVHRSWTTQPDSSSTFAIRAEAEVDVQTWIWSVPFVLTGGLVNATTENMAATPQVDVRKWIGTAVSSPTVAGVPNVNAKTWNDLATVALPLVPTTAGRTLDVSTGGEAGVDWANVGTPGSTVNLSATTTNLVNTVTTYTGNTVQTGDVYAKLPTNFASFSIDASGRVDVIKIAGTSQTARDIGASVLLSNGTGTGQVKLASGYVAMTWADIAAPTTTVNLSGTTIGVVTLTNTATTVTNQLTATAIATGVWQDAVAGDFTTASSIGKALYTGNFAPGATSGLAIVGSAMTLAAGYSDVVQTGTASAGATTTITIATALGTTADPVGMLIRITSGTGANQERIITGYVNATKVVTANYAWVTTPDNTSVYAISFANAPKIDSNLKVSGVVLADTVTAVTGLTASNLDTTVSSRMATYTQPTGFLAATFPSGTVANTTNITAATGIDVTKLLGTAWLAPGTAGTPDVNVKLWNALTTVALPLVPTTAGRTLDVSATGEAGVDWANVGGQSTAVNLSSTTIALVNAATAVSGQLTAAQIATGVWQDATAGDFTVALSAGKSIFTGVVPGASGGHLISGSNAGTTTLAAFTVTGATTLTGTITGTNASNNITLGTFTVTTNAIAWNAAWDAEVQSEVQDAIEVNNLDHLLKLAVDTDFPTTAHKNSIVGYLSTNTDTADYLRSAHSLQAAFGNLVSQTDAIDTAIAAIQSDTDNIQTRLPTALTSDGNMKADALKINGAAPNNVAATDIVSGGAITTSGGEVSTVTLTKTATTVTNAVSATLAASQPNYAPSKAGDSMALTSAAIAAVQSGLSTLTMAGVRTAVGLASANLDTQLGNLSADVSGVAGDVFEEATSGHTGKGSFGMYLGTTLPLELASIQSDLPQQITKNTALSAFPFYMASSTDHVTGKTGLMITATRRLDSGIFAACANAATEIGSGWYTINLAASDLNGSTVALRFTGAGADSRNITLITQPT